MPAVLNHLHRAFLNLQKSSHLKRIIRESEKLTASVNNRINNMADVRAELNDMSESSLSVGAQSPARNAKVAIRKSRQSARRSVRQHSLHFQSF